MSERTAQQCGQFASPYDVADVQMMDLNAVGMCEGNTRFDTDNPINRPSTELGLADLS